MSSFLSGAWGLVIVVLGFSCVFGVRALDLNWYREEGGSSKLAMVISRSS